MLKKKLIILFVILVVSLMFLTTCSKDPTGPDDDPLETILSDMTIVIDPLLVPILEFAEDHIEFDMPSWIPGLPEFEIGVILVCPPCEKAPNGFLRRITNIDSGLRTTSVNTEQGTLEETFEEADIDILEDLETTRAKVTYLADGVEFIPDSRDPTRFTFDLDHTFELSPGVNIHIDGDISFTQSFGLSVKIKWFRLKEITFSSNTVNSQDMDVTYTVTGGTQGLTISHDNLVLGSLDLGSTTIWISGVPVTIDFDLTTALGIQADGEVSISSHVTQSTTIDASVNYRRGRSGPDWYTTSDFTKEFSYTEPEANGSILVNVGLGPQLNAKLYGVAGPYIGIFGYLEYWADTSEVPWWSLDAGIKVGSGVEVSCMGYSASHSFPDFIHYRENLDHAPDNQCLPPQFDPPANTFFVEQEVAITCETAGSEIRYTTDGSEPTIISALYQSPILVESDTELRAKAFNEPDWVESCTASQFYNVRLFEDYFVFVEGGNFEMGDLLDEGEANESPVHEVTLNDFWMSKYEVTQIEYEALSGENPAQGHGTGDNRPVYLVSWYDAAEYCNKRSEAEDLTPCYDENGNCDFNANGYRLPTEAEWEYAARGGIYWPDNYRFSGTTNSLNAYAYYDNVMWILYECWEVGTRLPNQLGIYDMTGNVFEWCNDWYSSGYYLTSPINNPTGPNSGSLKTTRGLMWTNCNPVDQVAVARRNVMSYINSPNTNFLDCVGFRMCRNSDESTRGN